MTPTIMTSGPKSNRGDFSGKPGHSWTPVMRAISQISGGALISGLLGGGAVKIVSTILGPAGVALLGTLQQFLETSSVAATLNGQTALIQGASGLTGLERREFLRTSMCLISTATVAVILCTIGAPQQIARMIGLGAGRATLIRWLALPIALASLYVFLHCVVSALGAIRSLAGLQLAAPGALFLLAYPVAKGAARYHENRFSMLLSVSAAAAVVAAGWVLGRHRAELKIWFYGSGRWWSKRAARRFFLLSGSMLISGLASNGALMFVRVQILRREGLAVTGQFDAAWSVGMNLSTLLLATLQTYHLPALAKARSASQLVSHVMSMLNAVVPVAAVLIVGTAALKPSVLTLIYSPEFTPAARYLRWTLPGIYLKATAWVLAAPMLACAHSSVFLTAELAAWIVFSGGAVLLARWWAPAESAAIAFVVMYLVHLAVSVIYLRRHHEFRWDSRVGALWVAGLVVVVAATAANWSLDPKSLVSQLEYGALWTLGVAAIQVPFLWRGRTQCAE